MTRQHSPEDAQTPIDALSMNDALAAMLASHIAALRSVSGALREIGEAATLVGSAIERGATIHYAAAGSSGLMALADASELPGTFKVPQNQIRICMAGGVPVDGRMPGDTEDGVEDAAKAAAATRQGDVAIVVSASGTTPYALAFADVARQNGAKVISIANVAGSDLAEKSDIAVIAPTAAEVVEGSTRLGAGTAQKAVLNMISTQAGILLGHVHDGLMVNLHPDNIKLRRRAIDIVSRISSVSAADAERALESTGFDTKLAALVALGFDGDTARDLLARHKGRLQACLGDTETQNETTN